VWIPDEEIFGALERLVPPQTTDEYLSNMDGLFYDDYVDS
jgi:hypothetical protein